MSQPIRWEKHGGLHVCFVGKTIRAVIHKDARSGEYAALLDAGLLDGLPVVPDGKLAAFKKSIGEMAIPRKRFRK